MGLMNFRCAAIVLLLPLHCLASSVGLQLVPTRSILAPGESAFVDISATYDGSDLLLGGSVTVRFRADLLEVIAVTLRAPTDVASTTGSVSVSGVDGVLGPIGFATFSGAAGTFQLATIEFRALNQSGTSPLLAFDGEDPVYAWVNEVFDAVAVAGSESAITVSAIPEPRSVTLMLAGVALFAARASQRRAL